MVKKFLCLLIISLSCINVNASHHKPNVVVEVYLEHIKASKPNNPKNRIYMQVTEYSNINRPKEYRIPTYPKHWLQQDFLKITDIRLWKGLVKSREKKELIISLIENEFPPLDSDEDLGSIKLVLDNQAQNDQKIKIIWDKANFKEPIQIKKIISKDSPHYVTFNMQGKNSDYTLSFHLTTEDL